MYCTMMQVRRGVEVAGRTLDRKVEGSSPDINIIGCRQEGHLDIKWLTVPSKSPAMYIYQYAMPLAGLFAELKTQFPIFPQ